MASKLYRGMILNPLRFFSQSNARLFSTESPNPSSPPLKSFQAAKSALLAERNPDKLADFFIAQSTSFPRFSRHRPIFRRAVRRLSLLNRHDLVDRVLTHQRTAAAVQPLSEGFVIRIISLYSDAGMVDQALSTFDEFFVGESSGNGRLKLPPSEKSFCALLTAMLDNKMFDKFDEVFKNFPVKLSISPGVTACNLALKAYCERDQLDSAKELINKMHEEFGVVPDVHSYNVVLKECLKQKDISGFDSFVKEISQKGLVGNVTTYNLRIVRLCRNKECARAKKLLDEMISKDVKPNPASYNPIIDGFCRVGDLESAKALLDRMVNDEHAIPCSLTYYTLLKHMVAEEEYISGLEICEEILKRKWVPPFEATADLVKGLMGMSRAQEAKEVVATVKERLKGPAVDSWERKVEALISL